ncbi:MAG: hypothetical protein BWY71_01839 [Planctomycetes bacterium ADurb.Bin412]|nr:MAG: hypothetical protein BWY71_01839 [Planctomycetes bacterium ADurb.Bin412]
MQHIVDTRESFGPRHFLRGIDGNFLSHNILMRNNHFSGPFGQPGNDLAHIDIFQIERLQAIVLRFGLLLRRGGRRWRGLPIFFHLIGIRRLLFFSAYGRIVSQNRLIQAQSDHHHCQQDRAGGNETM